MKFHTSTICIASFLVFNGWMSTEIVCRSPNKCALCKKFFEQKGEGSEESSASCSEPRLTCHHRDGCFHQACIEGWLKKNDQCPECRAFIRDVDYLKILKKALTTKDEKEMKNLIRDLLNYGGNSFLQTTDTFGLTPLHQAAAANNPWAIKKMLTCSEAHANVEAKSNEGDTPLIVAAITNHPEAIKTLCMNGANTETRDADSLTALHIAAQYNHPEAIKALVTCNARIEAKTNFGETAVFIAATNNNPETINLLLDCGANPEEKSIDGITSLHIAVEKNNIKAMNALLSNKSNPANKETRDNKGKTALIKAAERNNVDAIHLLLNHNPKPADVNAKDYKGLTPLHRATALNYISAMDALLNHKSNHADIEAKANQGFTPVHMAASYKALDALKTLIAHKANLEAKTTERKYTALHLAVLNNDVPMIKILLDSGAKKGALDDDWNTPLKLAESLKKNEAAKILKEYDPRKKQKNNEFRRDICTATSYE